MTTAISPQTSVAPWQLDPSHTEIEFSARHLMISNVKGRFSNPAGAVRVPSGNSGAIDVEVTIPVATIDTRNEQRDAHLKSADFFDAETFPTITFKGTRIEGDPAARFRLFGDLTIHGITRGITLDVTSEGTGDDPWGNERLGFSATGSVNRKEFGLAWNQVLETGGVAVGDTIKIIINTELVRPKQK